jgi:uncharacterized protein (DUF433 family)
MTEQNNLLQRITLNSEVCNGKPSIRNMRFTVSQMLELLASGMTQDEILEDYPYIVQEDINEVLRHGKQELQSQ